MEEKTVSIEAPVTIAGVTLVPIVRTAAFHWRNSGGVSFFGFRQPVSLLAISHAGKAAFSATGEAIPLETLIEEVPGLKEVLEKL